jgi:hypothetical protein
VRKLVEATGGTLISFYFTTGESGFVAISEANDAESILAGLVAAAAVGAIRRAQLSSGYQDNLGFGFMTALGVKVANPGRAVVDQRRRRLHVRGSGACDRRAIRHRGRADRLQQPKLRLRDQATRYNGL